MGKQIEYKEIGVKELMVIGATTRIGLLIKAEKYKDFVALIDEEKNIADFIIDANKKIAIKLQIGIDAKNIIDTVAKPMKKAVEKIRSHLTQYMLENDFERLDGDVSKSITFQAEKVTKGILSTKQIKVGAKYVDLKTLSMDDLVEMLEAKGVKTRLKSEEKTTTKPASVIVSKS